jgi:hypothetical protein
MPAMRSASLLKEVIRNLLVDGEHPFVNALEDQRIQAVIHVRGHIWNERDGSGAAHVSSFHQA